MAELVESQTKLAFDADRLIDARQVAVVALRDRYQDHPTLEEIHIEMCRQLGWDVGLAPRSASAEIQAEFEMSRPISAGVQLLASVREQVLRVIYVSDMHLPSPVIRKLLQRHGCWMDGDVLWVSSEARVGKHSGHLFRMIADAEELSPADLIHIGDQPVADSAVPRWLGVQAAPFRLASSNRYEIALAQEPSLGSRLADAARIARISSSRPIPPEITDVATGVVGPLLVGYSLWLLRVAERRGLRRLYFLSRDGEIILSTIKSVTDALGLTRELRYLYGGRMAWKLPATEVLSDETWGTFLDELLLKHTRVSAEGVGLRLGLGGSELADAIGVTPEKVLVRSQRVALKSRLMTSSLRDEVAAYAEQQRKLAIAYLTQEGLGDGTPSAVVDVGWVGHTMRALADLLDGWAAPPLSLFVGYSGPAEGLPGGHDAYLWGGSTPTPPGGADGLSAMVEMFCAGSHGAVLGYEATADSIQPRLLSSKSIAANSWPLAEMRSAVTDFADALGPTLQPADIDTETAGMVMEVLGSFRHQPSPAEAAVWGSFPREEDPQGESVFPMARSFTLGDISLLIRSGPFAGRNLTWPQAAVLRTPLPLRLLVSGMIRLTHLSRRVRSGVSARIGRP